MVVRVENGQVRSVEHRPTDEMRWALAHVDAMQASDMRELLTGVSDALRTSIAQSGERPTAVRLMVKAAGALKDRVVADAPWFAAEVTGQALAVSDLLWLEKIKLVPTLNRLPAGLPPELAVLLEEALADPDCISIVEAAVAPLLTKLPGDIGDADGTPLLAAARSHDGRALVSAARAIVEAYIEGSEG